MITTQILAKVEAGRLQKAVEGLVSNAYAITFVSQTEIEIRGFVANGDGQEYGVVLSEGQSFCGCKDAIYRHGICKHAVALALFVIRTPQRKQSQQACSWHVGDTVQRNSHTGTVLCVSGDTGRTVPLTREELAAV